MENVKAKAWKFLIQHKLTELPQDLLSLNEKDVGFKIVSYEEGKEYIEALELIEYAQMNKGFSINDYGRFTIFYDDNLSYSERNYIIAHEIGHYDLGHTSYNKVLGKSNNKKTENMQEKEADIYSLAFLSPSPILVEMEIHSPSEIARITGLPKSLARKAAIDIINECDIKRTGIELELIDIFHDTIKKYSKREYLYKRTINEIATNSEIDIKFIIKSIIWLLGSILIFISSIIFSNAVYSKKSPVYIFSETKFEEQNFKKMNEYIDNLEDTNKVYITSSGLKYHIYNCQYIKNRECTEVTIEYAKQLNYTPCQVCIFKNKEKIMN